MDFGTGCCLVSPLPKGCGPWIPSLPPVSGGVTRGKACRRLGSSVSASWGVSHSRARLASSNSLNSSRQVFSAAGMGSQDACPRNAMPDLPVGTHLSRLFALHSLLSDSRTAIHLHVGALSSFLRWDLCSIRCCIPGLEHRVHQAHLSYNQQVHALPFPPHHLLAADGQTDCLVWLLPQTFCMHVTWIISNSNS